MTRGRKPYARRTRGDVDVANPLPRCPPHLTTAARSEWRRLIRPLYDAGVLKVTDRAAFAAYCQAYARWVEAEEKLKSTPPLLKTPSGYVQQSPWLAIANKQLEIMGKYLNELGLSPAARARLEMARAKAGEQTADHQPITVVERFIVKWQDAKDAETVDEEKPLPTAH